MQFLIGGEDTVEERVALRLVYDGDGTVSVVATDEKGEEWYLVEFSEGRYQVIEHVDAKIGIDVDTKGRIKERK